MGDARFTLLERMGRAIGKTRPGVYLLRYVFTPFDKLTYRLTGGRRGLSPRRMKAALLTTTGRRSGKLVTTPVLVLPDGDGFIVVGSNYGRGRHPSWTYNMMANRNVALQMGESSKDYVARRLSEGEARSHWPDLVRMWPAWQTYREITDRKFRMFRLEPAGSDQRRGRANLPN
ncbi:MAG: nitroreductase family deazaflavin-dependent oxidoreductase [Actinobacteria bacterium]|nr:nitroreductase family deazaflavin-dependent oxidoreductase [Actinomycetota bacterium]